MSFIKVIQCRHHFLPVVKPFLVCQVQELHEEEAQWVNYDEDELFVKLQLADSIFDALLKDTANAFTLISEKRAEQSLLS